MKNDPLEKLIKESGLQTSVEFTEVTMARLDRLVERRLKYKLYLLIAFILLFFVGMAVLLIYSGFQIAAFGVTLNLPKIVTVIGISLIPSLIIMHLYSLIGLDESFGKISM